MASSRGFTLVELMVVVVIIGVMASIGIFAMAPLTNAQNAAAVARSLQFEMSRSRLEAVSDNKQRQLSCTNSVCSYYVGSTTGMGAVGFAKAGDVISSGKHAQIWSVSASTDSANNFNPAFSSMVSTPGTITFYPDGSATAATVYIADTAATAGHKYKVYVYAGTGLARLVDHW